MLVYVDPAEIPEEVYHLTAGNRLPGLEDSYMPSSEVVNFSDANSIDELIGMLKELEEKNLHIVGSRGFVYRTERIRMMIENFVESGFVGIYSNFPRTGFLRDAYMRLSSSYLREQADKSSE